MAAFWENVNRSRECQLAGPLVRSISRRRHPRFFASLAGVPRFCQRYPAAGRGWPITSLSVFTGNAESEVSGSGLTENV